MVLQVAVGGCYRPSDWEEAADEAFEQLEGDSCLQAPIPMEEFNPSFSAGVRA